MPSHYGHSDTKEPMTKGKKKAKGKGAPRLVKGSKEAKDHMAKLRAMRGKK